MSLRHPLIFLFGLFLSSTTVLGQPPETGVLISTDNASPGYTLIAPFGGQKTYLIDLKGDVVHSWTMRGRPSQACYLLPDGSLLRTTKIENQVFDVPGGPAGGIQRLSWDGELLWNFVVSDQTYHAHHDIEPLPNGNVLVVVWERKSREDAIAAGRDPDLIGESSVWSEAVLEIEPEGQTGGRIVWEWHLWDHLVQSFDNTKPNFGYPSDAPHRVDLNYVERAIPDWIHMNSIDYNPDLDQIALSGRTFDEVWIIDHSTTSEQAKGSVGGRAGKGGDLLYRWGNPFSWFAGTPADQKLFGQHDPHWIPAGLPGAGNLLIFNNGSHRDGRPFSTVDEITPPVQKDGTYALQAGLPFGPDQLTWTFRLPDRGFSERVSGAQRLPNGNTLICSGENGRLLEVNKAGQIVWEFQNYLGQVPAANPQVSSGGGPGPLGGVAMFRATRHTPDDSAFVGHTLVPLSN